LGVMHLEGKSARKHEVHLKLRNLLVKQTELVKTVNFWYRKANHKKDGDIDQGQLS
jgi:hypothetical protein